MDEKDYIHEIVLKVFDTLTASIEHYQVEFVAFGKCYGGANVYDCLFCNRRRKK